jgi:hypothetical protein
MCVCVGVCVWGGGNVGVWVCVCVGGGGDAGWGVRGARTTLLTLWCWSSTLSPCVWVRAFSPGGGGTPLAFVFGVLGQVGGVVTRRTGVFPQLKVSHYNCGKCGSVIGPYTNVSDKEVRFVSGRWRPHGAM